MTLECEVAVKGMGKHGIIITGATGQACAMWTNLVQENDPRLKQKNWV